MIRDIFQLADRLHELIGEIGVELDDDTEHDILFYLAHAFGIPTDGTTRQTH